MALIQTITDDYHFWEWLKKSDNYRNNFTVEGARALQEYLDDSSEAIGEEMEFDPIAWCCEFSEYDSLGDAWAQYGDEELDGYSLEEWFNDRTTVIGLDNGGVIIRNF